MQLQPIPKLKDIAENSRDIIVENFNFLLKVDSRKHQQSLSQSDFNNLMIWIKYYFDNELKLPNIDKPIQKFNTNQGNIVYSFIEIYDILKPNSTRPDSLFELIKMSFEQLKNAKISNLKKTKKPQYYKK